jgi:hypothetical protein
MAIEDAMHNPEHIYEWLEDSAGNWAYHIITEYPILTELDPFEFIVEPSNN